MDKFPSVKKYIPIAGLIFLIIFFLFLTLSLKFFFTVKKLNISGVFIISGIIPPESKIVLLARNTQSGISFIPVMDNIQPESLTPWQYSVQSNNKSYEIKAEIISGGKVIVTSNTITAFAPSVNDVLTFNLKSLSNIAISLTVTPEAITSIPSPSQIYPTAKPSPIVLITPTPTISSSLASSSAKFASMSGTIEFTGQAPLNSRIVVFQRVAGTLDYQTAEDNIIPTNGSTWSWNQAVIGTTYELIAILKQKQSNGLDTDIVDSNTLTVSTGGGTFNINSNTSLSAPSSNISVNCNTLDGSSLNWSASVSFQTIQGAQSYWYEIGTTDGGNDLTNITHNAAIGSNQNISEPLKNGTTYFAKYAYSAVPNLVAGDPQFSPFSSTIQLKCSQ